MTSNGRRSQLKAQYYDQHLTEKAQAFFMKLTDVVQFPAARCDMGPNIFLYNHEASSGVESMNNANKQVRAYSVVDPVNSIMLLLNNESMRYAKSCEKAWKAKMAGSTGADRRTDSKLLHSAASPCFIPLHPPCCSSILVLILFIMSPGTCAAELLHMIMIHFPAS